MIETAWLHTVRNELKLPDLEIRLKTRWGSENKGARDEIRDALVKEVTAGAHATPMSEQERLRLLDLSIFPLPSAARVSIAHCRGVGGYALSRQAHGIGFDAEVETRILKDVVLRISQEQETEIAPFIGSLWGAKEAAFKALDRGRGLLVSQVKVTEWSPYSGGWKFIAQFESELAAGVVIREGPWLYALARTEFKVSAHSAGITQA